MSSQPDLFGLAVEVTRDCFSTIFASGCSAYWDAHGCIQAGQSVGVVAGELPHTTVSLLRDYVRGGGKVFVDTGMFSSFTKGKKVDFQMVFLMYDRLLSNLPMQAKSRFSLVMPDEVGNQSATLDLLASYKSRILGYIDTGADVIVPVQRGILPVSTMAESIFAMLGTRSVRLGLPSNAAALSDEELSRIRHDRFHVLGKATLDAKLKRRAYTLLETNPGASISCDANLMRSKLHLISHNHKQLIAAVDVLDELDDTELLYEILHGTNWMSRSQVGRIAGLYGITSTKQVNEWCDVHRLEGLNALIEEVDAEAIYLYQAMAGIFEPEARKQLSARLRSKAVCMALAA